MRTRALLVVAAMLPTSFLIAADGDCDARDVEHKEELVAYEACEQQVWFTEDQPMLGNLAEAGIADRPTWSDEAPTGSYQTGAWHGSLGNPAVYVADGNNEAGSVIFEGSFTGMLDTMSVTLDGSHMGYASTGDPTARKFVSMNFKLYVDDYAAIPLLLVEDLPSSASPNASGLDRYEFSIINIDKAMARGKLDFAADAEHTVRLVMAPNYVNTGAYFFAVYGASEVDGGIVFNDQDLSEDAFTIKV